MCTMSLLTTLTQYVELLFKTSAGECQILQKLTKLMGRVALARAPPMRRGSFSYFTCSILDETSKESIDLSSFGYQLC